MTKHIDLITAEQALELVESSVNEVQLEKELAFISEEIKKVSEKGYRSYNRLYIFAKEGDHSKRNLVRQVRRILEENGYELYWYHAGGSVNTKKVGSGLFKTEVQVEKDHYRLTINW